MNLCQNLMKIKKQYIHWQGISSNTGVYTYRNSDSNGSFQNFVNKHGSLSAFPWKLY